MSLFSLLPPAPKPSHLGGHAFGLAQMAGEITQQVREITIC